MNPSTTSTDAWQMFRRVYWTLAAAMALVLLLLAVLGFGPGGRNCKAEASMAAQAAPAMHAEHAPHRVSCRVG
jgi:Na+/H+ antiporter NhaC